MRCGGISALDPPHLFLAKVASARVQETDAEEKRFYFRCVVGRTVLAHESDTALYLTKRKDAIPRGFDSVFYVTNNKGSQLRDSKVEMAAGSVMP